MPADATPDNMGIARALWRTVMEGRATTISPAHLEDTWVPLYTFHAQTCSKRASVSQVFDHSLHGVNELILLRLT